MKVDDVLKLYAIRDDLSRQERELEDDIFSVQKTWEPAVINTLIGQYQRIKDKRNYASIQAARAFMTLSPSDRRKVNKDWESKREAKRKEKSTGLRGK